MSSTADKVNALWNVQMVQRRHLEKLYPYLDWSKMPFSSYNDFFRLKNIIDDCGAVWTNAYRRSNNEAADTRKYLKDYSGNGRDIELFNFAFAGMSGYGGYPYNFNNCEKWGAASYNNISSSRLTINAVTNGITFVLPVEYIPNRIFKAKLKVSGYDDNIGTSTLWSLQLGSDASGSSWEKIDSDGIHEVEYTLPEDATVLYIAASGNLSTPEELSSPIYVDLLPDYPCALVSDGVDDYGQCIEDFALPDDYTVVALRKYLNTADTNVYEGLISKTNGNSGTGAFLFEFHRAISFSYGLSMEGTFELPALFSYMSKNSFNGVYIGSGDSGDLETYKLRLFTRGDSPVYKRAALSSFGIFTRTLTEDELRIVENCMMAEYIAMTGILDDVEYYDILDARFRSNEEDAEKRNKWTGRFGKLHMTLNNYAYSKMSGWNGSEYDFYPINDSAVVTDNRIVISKASSASTVYSDNPPIVNHVISVKVKVSGLAKLVQKGEVQGVFLIAGNLNVSVKWGNSTSKDGIVDLSVDISDVEEQITRAFLFVSLNKSPGATVVPLSSPITIEIIPDYPGALVSDGVDDYAVSDEVIDEPIGGVAFLADPIQKGSAGYIFGAQWKKYSIFSYLDISDKIIIGDTGTNESSATIKELSRNTDDFYSMSRVPSVPEYEFAVALLQKDARNEFGKNAIYQLRLIKSQPTDIQLEAIKWQMQKEHEDYLIHNGWMEIEPDEQ